tara:strand:+ start:303 stop:440 length:138 start_codon:yes stop_codon:yes gene_type:complete
MNTFIGLLEIAAWITVVVGMAAGLTWIMIKVMPQRTDEEDEETDT